MEAVPHMRKLVLAGTLATVAALAMTSPAYGKGCSGSSSNPPSSVAQYIEQMPSSCGSKPTGTDTSTRNVPKAIENKIDKQGGQDAALLHKIVSSGQYGAPTHQKIKAPKPGSKAILSDSETRRSNPLAASVGVITDGSDSRLIVLVVLMAAVAGVVLVSALRRRRLTR